MPDPTISIETVEIPAETAQRTVYCSDRGLTTTVHTRPRPYIAESTTVAEHKDFIHYTNSWHVSPVSGGPSHSSLSVNRYSDEDSAPIQTSLYVKTAQSMRAHVLHDGQLAITMTTEFGEATVYIPFTGGEVIDAIRKAIDYNEAHSAKADNA